MVSIWPPVMWLTSAPSAVCRGRGWIGWPEALGGGEAAGHQADGRALDIALAAGDLAGEAQARHRLQAQRRVEELRRVEIGVAVKAAEARELGLLEPGNHPQDPGLLAVFQLGLEADHVEQGAERVVLAQLHDGVGLLVRLDADW